MIYNFIKSKVNILFLFAVVVAMFGFFNVFNYAQARTDSGCSTKVNQSCTELIDKANKNELCDDNCSAAECARLNSRVASCGLDPNSTGQQKSLTVIIGDLLRGLFGLLGAVFLVLIIYGGFLWMTAAGNDENISKAKKIITQAAVGLLVIVIAYALTDFIFDTIINATTTN